MTYIHNHLAGWATCLFIFWTICGYIGRGIIRGDRIGGLSKYKRRYAARKYSEEKLQSIKEADEFVSLRKEKSTFLQGPIGLGKLLYEAYNWGQLSQLRFSFARNTDMRDKALENYDVIALLIWICLLANPHPVFTLALTIILWSKMAPTFSACGNLATPRVIKLRTTNPLE